MPQFVLRRSRGLVALAGLAAVGVAVFLFGGAQAPEPRPVDEEIASTVAKLLERSHLTRPTINDEISKKWAREFIETLDPRKSYFEQADVEEFLKEDTTLDDAVKRGDVEFAREVFARFLERSDERLAMIQELLKEEPDFAVEESIPDDPKKIDFPKDAKEARERWRKWLKYERLVKKVSDTPDDEAVEQLEIKYKDLNRYFRQFDMTDLLEYYLTALANTIDPHSNYMGSKTLEDMLQSLRLELEGIGASLISENGYPVVKEIVPNGAADRDGRLQVDDKIVGLVHEDGSRENFVEKKLSDVVRQIRGPKGTKVRLIIEPAGEKEQKVYELTRDKIELTEAHAKGTVWPVKADDGRELKVGVLDLPAFYGNSDAIENGEADAVSATRDCRKILASFRKEGVDAVLVDLRGNGGGLLDEAIRLSGLFIDTGPVVQVREILNIKPLEDDEEGTAWDGPLVVLIDHGSASASEIFAGVIKDYGRGLIVGDTTTYGKGTVQSIIPLSRATPFRIRGPQPNLGALKLTIQQFYRANGESTQIKGVPADVHIPSLRDHMDISEGKSESALETDTIEPLPHDQYNKITPELVDRLQGRSDERRAEDEKFQKLQKVIKTYLAHKAKNEIPLNESEFRAENVADELKEAEDLDDESKEKDKPKGRFSEREPWKANFYNDEVMRIVADYVTLGKGVLVAAPVRAGRGGPSAHRIP